MEYEENGASAFATTLAHRIIFLTRILGGKKYKNSFPHFFFYYTLPLSFSLSFSLSLSLCLSVAILVQERGTHPVLSREPALVPARSLQTGAEVPPPSSKQVSPNSFCCLPAAEHCSLEAVAQPVNQDSPQFAMPARSC